ncbi:phage portal protein family protein [Corynebacterium cystitidis]|uniref:phage portal protein family protein n=1 Tax=Corynebacterium cystitidis TaxID=35757 RepID=UPI00211DE5DF|nr:hypothetical protein [Corynebacterium cystitidis]
MAELGVARVARNRALDEDNSVLKFPRSARTYGKMLRQDAKVRSVFRAVTLPIRRANWQLAPNGAPDEVVAHVAQDLRMRVKGEDQNAPVAPQRGRVSWDKHLEQLLYSLAYGYMFFEQVYEPGVDGREHLVKLAPRWPGTVEKINVAPDGGLASIEQGAYSSGRLSTKRATIPVQNLVAYVFDDVGSQWTGSSILRPAYKHWKLKDELLIKQMQTIDRNGMGVPVVAVSEYSDDPEKDLEYALEIAEAFRGGEASGVALKAGMKFTLQGVSGQIQSAESAINYHDNQIAISVLANFLNLEGKGGSYALADTQSDFFNQSEQTVADWVADTANQHVVEDLVEVAFPDYVGPCPRITFDAIGSRKELTAQDLATLARDKVIFMDPPTEEYVRDRYDLPASQPLSEALDAKKKRLEMEQEAGVTLASEPVDTALSIDGSLQQVRDTAELNARFRASVEESERILAAYRSQMGGG